jgi:ABC-type protease/lipase transport system fused ATPase/permease subunit
MIDMNKHIPQTEPSDVLRAALARCRGALVAVVFFSLCINLLMLTAPLYMLQVFDRVLNSRSVDTLLFLTLIAVVAFIALGAVEAVRHRMLSRIGGWIDAQVSGELLRHSLTGELGA